jgi:hypothetical protein
LQSSKTKLAGLHQSNKTKLAGLHQSTYILL